MKRTVIEWIVDKSNIDEAIKQVKQNKGAPGIDKMSVGQLDSYFSRHREEIIEGIRNGTYRPAPVRRTYIPKANGSLRPLGIPTVVDRVVQQAIAQVLTKGYEPKFSESSFGYRPNSDCHLAMAQAIDMLNEGYIWIVDLDIEKFFDTVNHDKLISILRENIKEKAVLHLIRSFLKAGIMEDGLFAESDLGMPQGGPLSPVLSNVYLDKLDKELEARGLVHCRYADDTVILVKSEMAANRVMKSITKWIEKQLFLKVNATKTKVVRPTQCKFLGFTFWKHGAEWECRPLPDRKQKLKKKIHEVLCRKSATALSLGVMFTKVNQIVRGWINYYSYGFMGTFMRADFGPWLRHRVRMIILLQWKKAGTIQKNLARLNRSFSCGFSEEAIYKVARSGRGPYARANGDVINFILSPKVLEMPNAKMKRPGLINPLACYTEMHNRFA